jgi:alkylation response protein AidB-like acyl-CoA dehydrogenase
MRTIGQCELAVDLMCERALTRRAFGKHLSDYANVQDWIAHSRVEIDQARLLVLQAAWKMDTFGNKVAHLDVSAIKLVAAQLQTRVVDRAMQVFGAMGLTPDTPFPTCGPGGGRCASSTARTKYICARSPVRSWRVPGTSSAARRRTTSTVEGKSWPIPTDPKAAACCIGAKVQSPTSASTDPAR